MTATRSIVKSLSTISVLVVVVAIFFRYYYYAQWIPRRFPPPPRAERQEIQTSECRPEIIDLSSIQQHLIQARATKDGNMSRDQEQLSSSSFHHLDACQVFTDTYRHARTLFRYAAQQVPGARLVSLPVYIDNKNSNYTMDLAVLPGTDNNQDVVIHTSGVHGIEGYAGSAIQMSYLKLLKELHNVPTTENDDDHPDDGHDIVRPTVILVHAFNPFGMAHYRRVNEHNVDLNRNGLRDFSTVVTNQRHHHPKQRNENYDKFHNLFSPQIGTGTSLMWVWLRQWLVFAMAAITHGIPKLKTAMVQGQYHDASGIMYGGTSLQASYAVLEEWLQRDDDGLKVIMKHARMTTTRETDNVAEAATTTTTTTDSNQQTTMGKITWIDVHTGLGPSGEDTILPSYPKTTVQVVNPLVTWFPNSHHPTTSVAGANVISGYDHVMGQVGDYFSTVIQPFSNDAVFVVQEFGTLPSPFVGHALIVENVMFQQQQQQKSVQSEHKDNQMIYSNNTSWQLLQPAFYPDDATWRASIVTRGLRVLLQAMQRPSLE